MLTFLVPVGINVARDHAERAEILERYRAARQQDAGEPKVSIPTPARTTLFRAPRTNRTSTNSAGTTIAIWAFVSFVGVAALAALFVILRPMLFLLEGFVEFFRDEYRKMFPNAWFDFPGLRGNYRSDGARWTAITIILTSCSSVFWFILAARSSLAG